MRVSSSCRFAVLTLTLAIPSFLFADYTYQETTQITGGSMMSMMKMAGAFSSQARKAGEPVVSTVYIKDNRMAKVSTDSIEIIDLDKETITHRRYAETYLHGDDVRADAAADAAGPAGDAEETGRTRE